ncbi:hypothetical protein ASD25_17100 [Brevundimonas sp. Root1423]|nr:hypothetical protein ASD25_17100 [Brevundimonas sp. Root1423]KRA28522.1 hypothetical protein ASD59_01440 [Brevundimonas sp. Root608]
MPGPMEVEPLIDRREIVRRIERLHVSADLKALLSTLIETTVVVGGKIVQIGCRVLAYIFDLAKSYPKVTFGVVAALVLSFLISSIPLLGPLLSPVLTPILLIIGLGWGALQDMIDGPMRNRLSGLEAQFKDLGVA